MQLRRFSMLDSLVRFALLAIIAGAASLTLPEAAGAQPAQPPAPGEALAAVMVDLGRHIHAAYAGDISAPQMQ